VIRLDGAQHSAKVRCVGCKTVFPWERPWAPLEPVFVPYEIDKATKKLADQQLAELLQTLGRTEHDSLNTKLSKKLESLSASQTYWVRQMAMQLKSLSEIMRTLSFSENTGEAEAHRLIAATLEYFVITDDVIPDHIAGSGYLDDAYLMNKCINLLRKRFQHISE
jgi:uncharacterized membrane protein YkvA (DUF1232 family)